MARTIPRRADRAQGSLQHEGHPHDRRLEDSRGTRYPISIPRSGARLTAAGAILLGKLNLHEFAAGATNTNPHWGACRNPYNLARIPGGSSGGSAAAIVAQMAAATIGTDTGGSIRIPAAFCGCVGMKQTWSRVSRYGVLPLADSLDHAGPITRSDATPR